MVCEEVVRQAGGEQGWGGGGGERRFHEGPTKQVEAMESRRGSETQRGAEGSGKEKNKQQDERRPRE